MTISVDAYLWSIRLLVRSAKFSEALEVAEALDSEIERELTLAEMGELSMLMEHAGLGASVQASAQ